MPPGIEQNYDCFNFCGGIFVSSCDFSGQCGTLTCSNATAAGTMNGQVQGCTYQDYLSYQPDSSSFSTSTSSSGGGVSRRSNLILRMMGASIVLLWIPLAFGGTTLLG